jgi:hypothetical protein
MKILFALLAAILAFPHAASGQAQPPRTWDSAKAQALQAFDVGNCAQVWQRVWPWARAGNAEAQAILATGAQAAGLTPPGAGQDGVAKLRHMLILSAHGASAGDSANLALLHALLQEPLLAGMGGRELRQCLLEKKTAQNCVQEAVRRGFIPDMASYASELDWLAKQKAATKATCHLPKDSALPVPGS